MGISGDLEWLKENDPEGRTDWMEYLMSKTGSYLLDELLDAGYKFQFVDPDSRQMLVWRADEPHDKRLKSLKHDRHLERFIQKLRRDVDYFDTLPKPSISPESGE